MNYRRGLLAILLCFAWFPLQAQYILTKTSSQQTIELGEAVDSLGVARKFGIPQEYNTYFDDEVYSAQVTTCGYPDLHLTFVGGKLESFSIDSPAYVFTIHGTYRVKVGDRLSTLLSSIPSTEVRKHDYSTEMRMYFKIPGTNVFDDDSLIVKVNSLGVITEFYWFSPI